MKLAQLDNPAVDLEAASAQSAADIPLLQDALKSAEQALARAEAEKTRLASLWGKMGTDLAALLAKMRAAKTRWLQSAVDQTPDLAAWREYSKFKSEREALLEVYSYAGIYPLEDSVREVILKSLDERNAYADLIEGRAAHARAAHALISQKASLYDPGSSTDVEKSWSSSQYDEARRIRDRVIGQLKDDLAQHDKRVKGLRELSETII